VKSGRERGQEWESGFARPWKGARKPVASFSLAEGGGFEGIWLDEKMARNVGSLSHLLCAARAPHFAARISFHNIGTPPYVF